MPSEYLTTREVAALLRIKERKVYDLVASGQVPCSKSMGKLLFPRSEIEAWLAAGQLRPEQQVRHPGSRNKPSVPVPRPNVMLGSHDPLLEWALRESRSGIAAYFDGSGDGLHRFAVGEGVAAGLHVFDAVQRTWNEAAVADQFGKQAVVLVEWARRQRGLIVGEAAAQKVGGLTDLAGLRVAARQPGAGAQLLFRTLCAEAGLPADVLNETVVLRSETDAALAVLEDKADVSFGLQPLAEQYRLAFVPVIEERYDLLVDRRAWFEPPIQALMRFCAGPEFRGRAAELSGYDVRDLGRVHFNGP